MEGAYYYLSDRSRGWGTEKSIACPKSHSFWEVAQGIIGINILALESKHVLYNFHPTPPSSRGGSWLAQANQSTAFSCCCCYWSGQTYDLRQTIRWKEGAVACNQEQGSMVLAFAHAGDSRAEERKNYPSPCWHHWPLKSAGPGICPTSGQYVIYKTIHFPVA